MASRWTPGALSHDFGGREPSGVKCVDGVIVDRYDPPEPFSDPFGTFDETACHWPAKWRPIAVAILDLPVPVRDEPGERSGEVGRG